MDQRKPITKNKRLSAAHRRAGFGVAPILYMLGLIGVGAGILFSSYSQTLKTNIQMTNNLAVKSDLDASATTLSATSVLGATDSSYLCPPQGGVDTSGSNCVNAPVKMTEFYPSVNVTTSDVHLPSGYAAASGGGSPVEVGIFTSGAGVKQVDPWGHYYIYCRWESVSNSTVNPAIEIISAGPDGILQTTCGSATAAGDDTIIRVDAANAVNRSAVWQTGTVGSSTPDVYYGTVGHQLSVDANGNLTVPGNITADGSYDSPTGDIVLNAGNFIGSVVGGTISGSTGTFSGDLSAENLAFTTGAGGTVSAVNGAFSISTGGALSAASGAFGVDNSGDLTVGSSAMTVAAASGNTAIGGTLAVTGQTTLGSTLTTAGLTSIGTSVAAAGSSTPLFTVGKKVSLSYPFSVDQYGSVTASTFNGSLVGNQSGGTIAATSITDSTTLQVTGNYTSAAGNITIGGTISAANFSGSMTLGSGGLSLSGVLPLANGGTGYAASSNSDLLNELGVTSSGYLNTALLTADMIPGGDLVNQSVGTNQLAPTGVGGGTFNNVTVDATGRVISGFTSNYATTQVSDGTGDTVAVGSGSATITVGSSIQGLWNSTGLMIGEDVSAVNKLDVYGATAIGTSYAGVDTAPANGLIVAGSVGIGTSSPTAPLQVNGNIIATGFVGSGSQLTGIGTSSISGIIGTANGGTGTATTFTQGSVVFAGPSGIYTQDNANFFWNDSSHYLGIGTSSPTQALEVNGNAKIDTGLIVSLIYPPSDGTSAIQIDKANGSSNVVDIDTSNGRIGIGSATPLVSLDLSQNTDAIALPYGDGSNRPSGSNATDGEIRYNTAIPGVEARISGVWTPLAAGGGDMGVSQGGTGDTSLTAHAVLVGEGTSPVAAAGPGAIDTVLVGNGASADPSFSGTPTLANLTLTNVEALNFGTDYTTTGAQADVPLNTTSAIRYNGSTTAIFYGIVAGTAGQILYLHNASNYTLTLSNLSSSESTVTNKIITGTGGDMQMAANSSVVMQYDGSAGMWRVIGGSGQGVPAGTTGQVQFNSGSNSFAANANLFWDNSNYRLGIGSSIPTQALDVAGNINLTGNVTTGTWNGVAIGTTYGGTGQTTYSTGDILYASAPNTLSKLAAGSNGNVLTLASGVPSWAAVSVGTGSLTGTVQVSQGGTSDTSLTQYAVLLGNGTSPVAFAGPGTSGQLFVAQGASANPAFETLSGDCALLNTGAITCTKTNGTAFGALATLGIGTGLNSSGGNLNLTIPVIIADGGTNATSQTTNGVNYFNGTSITSGSTFVFNGTNVGIGTTTLSQLLTVNGNIDAMGSGNGYLTEIANDTTTGTVQYSLAKLTTAGKALTPTSTGDTDGMIGIVVSATATSGNAQIAVNGQAICTFENTTTKGDFVTIGTTTAGDCRDNGTTRSGAAQTIGRVLTSGSSGTTQTVELSFNGTGGGVPAGTTGQVQFNSGSDTFAANANLFWDNSNYRLAIGTSAAPLSTLDIYGGTAIGTSYAGVTAAPANGAIIQGNVGIGTASPSGNNSLLFVAGNISSVGQGQLTLQGATNANQQLVVGYNTGSDYGSIQAIKQGVSDEPLILNGGGGNVGIGTTNPNLAQLQTSGSGYTAAIIGHMGMWGAVNTDPAYTFNSYIDSSYTSRAIATGYGGLIWLSSGAAGGPAGSMVFYTMPSTTAGSAQTSNEAMRITPSGYIGIGSSIPTQALDVAGNINLTGNVTTGTWNGVAIGTTYGGTGQTTYSTGDILYASAPNTLSKLAAGSNGNVLTLASGVPSWAAVSVGTGSLTGTVQVSQGGTSDTSLTQYAVLLGNGTSPVAFAGPGTSGQLFVAQGASANPAFETLSGDCALLNTGAITCTKTNGTAFGALATLGIGTGLNSSGGNLNLTIPVIIADGGTNATSQTTNGVNYFNGTSITSGSTFVFNGTNVGIGTTTLSQLLTVNGNIDAMGSGNGYLTEIANDTTTGTVQYSLAKLTTAGKALTPTSTGDTDGMIGIVVSATATSGNAQIAVNGQAICTFENTTTKGDFVTIGTTTAGDCRDNGTTRSGAAQTIGRVLTSGSSGTTQTVELSFNGTGGGVPAGTTGQVQFNSGSDTFAANANLFWDNSNYRLAIGTSAAPLSTLDIYGGTAIGTSYAGVTAAPANGAIIQGNVGIGTTNPLTSLQISAASAASKGMMTIVDAGHASTSASLAAAISGFGNDIGASNTGRSWYIGNDGGSQQFDIFYAQSGPMAFYTGGSQQMTIGSTGNVGIGTAVPGAPLHIVKNGGTGGTTLLQLDSNDTWGQGFNINNTSSGGHEWQFYSYGSGSGQAGSFAMYDATGGGYRLFISSSGQVGIGNSSPNALLDVGAATSTLGTMRLEGSTSGYVQIQPAAAAGSWTMTLPASTGSSGQVLQTDGTGITSWQAVSVGTGNLTGTVQVSQGGTSDTSLTQYAVLLGNGTSPVAFAGPGTSGQLFVAQGASANPAFETLSGDCALLNTGAITCTKTNGTAFGALATLGIGTGLNSSGGNLNLTIPVIIADGGTNATSQTTNGVNYFNGTSITSGSTFVFNGTNVGIGTTTLSQLLTVNGNIDAMGSGNGYLTEIANDTTTGTVQYSLAKLTTAGKALTPTSTGDTDGMIGIVVSATATSGNAQIAVNGQAICTFENTTTKGDFVTIGTTTAGDCRDNGTTRSGAAQTIGRVLTSGSSGTTQTVELSFNGTGGGVPAGTTGQVQFNSGSDTFAANANLFWDNSNYRLAIGTSAAPLSTLDIYGGTAIGTSYAGVTAAPANGAIIQGNVGIGTTNPLTSLQISAASAASKGMMTIVDAGHASTSASLAAAISGFGNDIGASNTGRSWYIGNDGGSQQFDIFYAQSGPMAFYTGGSQQMTIGSTGNVGIGTTAPVGVLNVASSTATDFVRFGAGTNNSTNLTFGFSNLNNGAAYLQGSVYGVSATASLNLNPSGGNVGIGTTAPDAALHIVKNGGTGGTTLLQLDSNDTWGQGFNINNTSSGGHEWQFYSYGSGSGQAGSFAMYDATGGGYRLFISSSGQVGIGNSSPNALLDVGAATSTLGTLRLEGSTSGYVQIQPAAAAGSWTMTLPASTGSSGQVLQTDGTGITSWQAVSVGTGNLTGTVQVSQGGTSDTSLTQYAVLLGNGTSPVAFAGPGTSGQLFVAQGASANPAFETLSGDCALLNTGAITCTKTNGTAFGALATLGIGTGLNSSGGNLNLTIPVIIADGGTNATSQTTNGVNYFNGTSITSGSTFVFNGTNVGIGTTTLSQLLTVNGNIDAMGSGNGYLTEIANAGTTGTTVNKLAKLNTSGAAVIGTSGDTDGMIGVVVGETAGGTSGVTTGNAQIAVSGQASCIFDGTTVAGDFVTISSSVAGDCSDTGSSTTRSNAAQTIGRVLTVNSGTGTAAMVALGLNGTGGGVPAGTTGQVQYNSGSNTFAASSSLTYNITYPELTVGTGAATPVGVGTSGIVAGFAVNIIPQATSYTTANVAGGVALNTAATGQMAYYSGASTVSGTPNLYVSGGNIGIGTSTATNLLSLSGSSAQTIWMERGATTGNNLTLQAGGGLSGGTNENGGNLILASGISTGTGSSQMQFNVYEAGSGGTSNNNPTTAMTIGSSGNVGIGTATPLTALDVNGTILSISNNAGSATAINWNQGNVQYTSASCGAFTFTNMQDGGSYSLIVTGASAGTCSFSQSGLTFKAGNANLTSVVSTSTVFTFLRAGSIVYINAAGSF